LGIGKRVRIERIMNRDTGKTVIVPMDHGVSSGPMKGLINIKDTVEKIAEGGANAIILHKGIVEQGHRGKGKDVGLIIHMSASTDLSLRKNDKGTVSKACLEWQMPLVAMLYYRGPEVKNPFDPDAQN